MRWNDLNRQDCSLAKSLSVFGDLWTLMILRDCFLGVKSFDNFSKSLGISRSIVSNRLSKLVENAILVKVDANIGTGRKEYRLTPKGLSLYPIILSIVKWGDANFEYENGTPITHIHKPCGHNLIPAYVCNECGLAIDPKEVEVKTRSL